MSDTSTEVLEDLLGYRFRQPELLQEALTHSSFAREGGSAAGDNETLEFLGDAVLNFLVSERLVRSFPASREGSLSRARARLVAAEHLVKVGESLDLGKYLRLGKGEEKTGGRTKSRLLVDAVEALVAAIYCDGGLRAAQNFITRFILPLDLNEKADELFSIDYKSALQEELQGRRHPPAIYRVVDESGPEHHKTFEVEASADGLAADGSGPTKKLAEQEAAQKLLKLMGVSAGE